MSALLGGRVLHPRRIAFINEKGGSAKTTLVANLAAHLALNRGRRVLAIDMDPQGQLGKVLGLDIRRSRRSSIELLLDTVLATQLPIARTRIPDLEVIVANKSLALFPAWEGGDEDDPTGRLKRKLDAAEELRRFDFVFFDAPPSFGALTVNVLRACDEVVVPVPLTYLAMDGCAELLRTIETVRRRYDHPELKITMVVPTFYRRTRLAREILERLKSRFPKEIAHTVVGYHVKIDEAQSHGLSIFEYAPNNPAARVMAHLAEELEVRGQPTQGAESP